MPRRKLFQVFVAAVVAICMLILSDPVSAQRRNDQAFDRARQTQERHTDKLMAQDGVVGTAVGQDESGRHAVLVLLERPGVAGIPTDLEGVPVRPVVTGKIYARAKPAAVPTKSGRDRTPPAAPSGLTATASSSSQIDLTWTANTEADLSYYNVYRSTTSAGTYGKIGSAPKGTSPKYSNTGLPSSMTYWYRVTAVDISGNESAKSTGASAITKEGPMPARWCPRPVPIGVSTGHPSITAGTIGCRVKDAAGNLYALSNNHVYANENNATTGVNGDKVLQPGVYDGGVNPRDAIGTLYKFKPIVFSRTTSLNTIDAAIAAIIYDGTVPRVGFATPFGLSGLPNGYGIPSSTCVLAVVGQPVQKYGRTSSLTKGTITGTNVAITVGYSSGRTARFVNQIIVESDSVFIQGGDSGSLLVTNDDYKNPVGLLFAGDDTGKFAVANRIELVLSAFGVTVDGE